jgi:hypothetical protein
MNIIRFVEPVTCGFKKSAGGATIVFEAMRDYVIAQAQLDRIIQDENVRNRLYKCSRLEPRLQPFNPHFRRSGTQRVLFYNGSGGYGDQILSWPVAKWLADQGMEVHILTDPGNQSCWYNFPWVKTIQLTPMPYELFKMFDYHFIMEHVNNTDEHQDQLHPVDAMFNRMGVDYRSIAPEAKSVRPVFTWAESQARNNFPDRPKIGLFQLSSANPIRALPANDTAFLLMKVCEAFPDLHWVALYDEFIPKEYINALNCRTCEGKGTVARPASAEKVEGESPEVACPDCKTWKFIAPNMQPWTCPSLRDLWAFTQDRASVVVSSDSLMVHVAGCLGVPCVGLWGPVAPGNRVMYYKNHHPVWKRESCPHSPCFAYTSIYPKYCPPRGGARNVCEVMAAITPSDVIDAISRARR